MVKLKRVFIFATILFFTLAGFASASNIVFEYGFEDWGGSISETSNYPFSSNQRGFMEIHADASEVVGSYDGLSPHSGDYFWLLNHGSVPLYPSVDGITSPAINPYDNLGLAGEHGGNNNWESNTISTSECFIRFWMATDGWENMVTNGKLKLVRYKVSTSDALFYIHHDKTFSIYAEDAYHYGGVYDDIDDRNWHKFGFYVNYDTGQTAIWYDVHETETLENATLTWTDPDGQISGGPTPDPIVLISNWSAHNPVGEVWHALDDIEIWDGLPDSEQPGVPAPVRNLRLVETTSP